jgi:glycosyltransferase involved in cell wall biosynthesis
MKTKFIIVMPLYNAEKWIGLSIKSVLKQDYNNYHCVIADDGSTDTSYEVAEKLIGADPRFTLIKNYTNKGPLVNAYEAAMIHSPHQEKGNVVVILDGDDFFFSKDTLSILNDVYTRDDCWMTYGSYINLSDKKRGKFSRQVPKLIIENNLYRQSEWCTSHLRSYRLDLLKKVAKKDLLDEEGNYFKAAGDLAIMFLLLEMSGDRASFIGDILYVWNDLNEMNEHKTKRNLQLQSEMKIRSMKKYAKLDEL